MALRRKRPALKSDAVKKFLEEFFAKATGPVPDSEVKKAAKKRGLNLNMLDEISRGYVNKKRGPGGISYWSKRTASAYLSDTAAAARKNSVAFRAGYEEAITSMLWSVNSICSATRDRRATNSAPGCMPRLSSLERNVIQCKLLKLKNKNQVQYEAES